MEWFTSLDATVQVAVLGLLGAGIAAVWGLIAARLSPKSDEKKEEFGPKPSVVALSEVDRLRFDRATYIFESLTDTIESLRVELSLIRRR